MMATHRWPCSVPGCRCTVGMFEAYRAGTNWALCQKHWKLVPRRYRAALRRAEKRRDVAAETEGSRYLQVCEARNRLARRVVRFAVERAIGI